MSPIVKKITENWKVIPPWPVLRGIVDTETCVMLSDRELDSATDTVADELADYLPNPIGSY